MNARRRAGQRLFARECGLALLALLIGLALAGLALMAGLDVWSLQRQREQEQELLFVGDQYRVAIERYYLAGRSLPMSVDDLLEDHRFPVPLHHLRRAYADPLTGKSDWRFLRDGGRIYGIYSASDQAPIKHANFPRRYEYFANAQTYGDWQFFYMPPGVRGSTNAAGQSFAPTLQPGRIAPPHSAPH